jgi:hypothetical protein
LACTWPDHHRRIVRRSCAALIVLGLLQSSVAAPDSVLTGGLTRPLRCVLGETCWVANYVDVDPTPGARDFRCGPRTYDGHTGVDFAVRDLGVMRAGVAVIASAAGTVRNVRDGLEDVAATEAASRARVSSRECGNGVVIEHADEWETQYCHLRRGSVRVKAGDRVARGTPIGLVGLSGETEFPHLHLSVRHKGIAIDPFTGRAGAAGCGLAGKPLWQADQPVPYEEVALYNAGFAGGQPDIERIRRGEPGETPVTATSPALVLWVDMLGVRAGDTVRLTITGPRGERVVDQQQTIDRTQARRYAFAGRRNAGGHWPAGRYRGEAVLIRGAAGPALGRIVRTVTIEDGSRN